MNTLIKILFYLGLSVLIIAFIFTFIESNSYLLEKRIFEDEADSFAYLIVFICLSYCFVLGPYKKLYPKKKY